MISVLFALGLGLAALAVAVFVGGLALRGLGLLLAVVVGLAWAVGRPR